MCKKRRSTDELSPEDVEKTLKMEEERQRKEKEASWKRGTKDTMKIVDNKGSKAKREEVKEQTVFEEITDSCCSACFKFGFVICLNFFNIIIWILGWILIGFGIFFLADYSYVINVLGHQLYLGFVCTLIVAGGIAVLATFIGCCGSLCNIKCCMALYLLIVVIGCGIALAAAGFILIGSSYVKDVITKSLNSTLATYDPTVDSVTRSSWDALQQAYSCCGINSISDWNNISSYYKSHSGFPTSCCIKNADGAIPTNCTTMGAYQIGCYSTISQYFANSLIYEIGAAAFILCLLILIVLGIIVCCAMKKRKIKKITKIIQTPVEDYDDTTSEEHYSSSPAKTLESEDEFPLSKHTTTPRPTTPEET